MRRSALAILTIAVLLPGCEWVRSWWPWAEKPQAPQKPQKPHPAAKPLVEPLVIQQAKAYPETATNDFVSLVHFEDEQDGRRGHDQIAHFMIVPRKRSAERKFVVNITRTGVGAMRVVLPPKCELVFTIPDMHDFSSYTLVSMALYSEAFRDDLRVALTTDGGPWTSHRTLLRRGWNTVLIDIKRLARHRGFDITGVRTIRLSFADAAGPVAFNLDDVMLVNNARVIQPVPTGVMCRKVGLDHFMSLPGWRGVLAISQSDDGLWRLGTHQTIVQLADK